MPIERQTRPQSKSTQSCLQGKGYKGLADPVRLGAYTRVLRNLSIQSCTEGSRVTRAWQHNCCELAHTHTHMLQNRSIEGCTQHPRVTRAPPTKCCCEHTPVYYSEIRFAPRGRNFTRAWPEHTHFCCRTSRLWAAPQDQGLQGFA